MTCVTSSCMVLKGFVARLFGVGQLLRLDPLADELLFDGLAHVAEEGASAVVSGHVHVLRPVAVQLRRGIVLLNADWSPGRTARAAGTCPPSQASSAR